MTGTVFNVKEMAVHDGPGIRTTVFLKGCPLRCRWCHNPEGLSKNPELAFHSTRCLDCGACKQACDHPECKPFGRCLHICPSDCLEVMGRRVEATDLANEIITGAKVLGSDFGGVTFSGGEPLMQADFLLEMTELLKGYHLAIETCGYASAKVFKNVISRMDYVIMDIKLADDVLHQRYTRKSNQAILQNYNLLRESGVPFVIRTPLIPNITDTEENLRAIADLIKSDPWEKLPYNELAGAKYAMLGKVYDLYSRKKEM